MNLSRVLEKVCVHAQLLAIIFCIGFLTFMVSHYLGKLGSVPGAAGADQGSNLVSTILKAIQIVSPLLTPIAAASKVNPISVDLNQTRMNNSCPDSECIQSTGNEHIRTTLTEVLTNTTFRPETVPNSTERTDFTTNNRTRTETIPSSTARTDSATSNTTSRKQIDPASTETTDPSTSNTTLNQTSSSRTDSSTSDNLATSLQELSNPTSASSANQSTDTSQLHNVTLSSTQKPENE